MGLKDNQIKFIEAVTANRIPFLQEDKSDLVISTVNLWSTALWVPDR